MNIFSSLHVLDLGIFIYLLLTCFTLVFVPDGINSVGDYSSARVGVVVVVVCLSVATF